MWIPRINAPKDSHHSQSFGSCRELPSTEYALQVIVHFGWLHVLLFRSDRPVVDSKAFHGKEVQVVGRWLVRLRKRSEPVWSLVAICTLKSPSA